MTVIKLISSWLSCLNKVNSIFLQFYRSMMKKESNLYHLQRISLFLPRSNSVPVLTVTPRRLVRPSRLTLVNAAVMILMNMVMMIRPANIHISPRSFPGIVLGAKSPYLKYRFIITLYNVCLP